MIKNKLIEALEKSDSEPIPSAQLNLSEEIKKRSEDKFNLVDRVLGVKEEKSAIPYAKVTLTLPEEENQQLEVILDKLYRSGVRANKSQVIRIGINMLSKLDFDDLLIRYNEVEKRIPGKKISC